MILEFKRRSYVVWVDVSDKGEETSVQVTTVDRATRSQRVVE